MRAHWISLAMLFALALWGCSSTPEAYANPNNVATSDASSGNRGIASIATEGRVTEDVVTEETTSSSTTVVVTANPTWIPLVSIQENTIIPAYTTTSLGREGWQTFTSPTLGVSMDYPSDWSAGEQANGATFTSPQGTTIRLQTVNASIDNEIRIGNRRCTSRTNAYHLTADICVDTASFIYSAKFALQSADGSTQWLALTTTTRTIGDVFEAMFNSVRLVR